MAHLEWVSVGLYFVERQSALGAALKLYKQNPRWDIEKPKKTQGQFFSSNF